MEAETVTLCAFMWPSHYHKCPFLKSMAFKRRGKPIFHTKGKRETSNFWCMLAGLLGMVLSRDRKLFCVIIGNDYDKMLFT
jgi:hypothetical protein